MQKKKQTRHMLLWSDNALRKCWENTKEVCRTLGYAVSFTRLFHILPTLPHGLLHHKSTRLVFYLPFACISSRIFGRMLCPDIASPELESPRKWRKGKNGRKIIPVNNEESVMSNLMTGEPDDPPQVATVCSTPCSSSLVSHCRQSLSGSVFSPPNAMCLYAPCGCPIMHKRLRISGIPCILDDSSRKSGFNFSKLSFFVSSFGHLIVKITKSKHSELAFLPPVFMEQSEVISATLHVTPRSLKSSSES